MLSEASRLRLRELTRSGFQHAASAQLADESMNDRFPMFKSSSGASAQYADRRVRGNLS